MVRKWKRILFAMLLLFSFSTMDHIAFAKSEEPTTKNMATDGQKHAIVKQKDGENDTDKNVAVAEPRGVSSFVRIREIYYPSWLGNWSTVMGTIDGKLAYCLEASKNTPPNGNYETTVVNNDNLLKVLYYAYGGAGQSVFLTETEDIAYLYTHILASYAYSGDLYGGHGFDWWDQHGIGLRGVYNLITSYPSPSILQFNTDTLQATYDPNSKIQRTNTITLQAVSKVAVYIPLEDGVTLHNTTTGQTQTGGTGTVYGGQSFYLETKRIDLENKQYKNLKGENLYRYAPLAFSPGGNNQTEGTITVTDFVSLNLNVNWIKPYETWDLKKIDDTGKPIANATYSLYVADSSYAIQQDTPVFTGITDTKGNISVDPNVNTDLTLAALRAKSKYYVLKEEQAPAGYQKAADVHLALIGDTDHPYFIVKNQWESGAITQVKQKIRFNKNSEIDNNKAQYPNVAAFIEDTDTGRLLYQTTSKTWKSTSTQGEGKYAEAYQANPIVLSLGADNTYEAIMDLPYNYTSTNMVWEVMPTPPPLPRYDTYIRLCDRAGNCLNGFSKLPDEVHYSSTIVLTNKRNQFSVEKVNVDGKALADAQFTLYDQDNIKNENGTITIVKDIPYEQQTTDAKGQACFGAQNQPLLSGRTYYLMETKAPLGYDLNEEIVEIKVTDQGVFANAKKQDDGILVKKHIKNVIASFLPYAQADDIDTTLQDMKMQLSTADTFTGTYIKQPQTTNLKYHASNTDGIYDVESGPSFLQTDSGWGKLQVEQRYSGTDTMYKFNLNGKNVAGLFMEQTVIQVMDQKATSLEIEKQVIGDNQNETFKFTVMFQDAVSKKYSATIYNADGSKQKDITTSYGILNAELKHKEKLVFPSIDVNEKYFIQETLDSEQSNNYNVSIKVNDETIYYDNKINGVIEKGENHVIFMNTIKKTADFTFTKTTMNDVPLANASFGIYELNCTSTSHDHTNEQLKVDNNGNLISSSACWKAKKRVISAGDGNVTFSELSIDKEYRLMEYKAPSGYLLPDGSWKLCYDTQEKEFKVTGIVGNVTGTPAFKKESSTASYHLPNYQQQTIPDTGFTGKNHYLLWGGMLMLLGFGWRQWQRERKHL